MKKTKIFCVENPPCCAAGWIFSRGGKLTVKGSTTYTAYYTDKINEYTVKFINDDGTVLQESKFAYGQTPAYKGEATYTATCTEKAREYQSATSTSGIIIISKPG